MFEGVGCMDEIVAEWDAVFESLENAVVIQAQSMSGFASIGMKPGSLVIELGQ